MYFERTRSTCCHCTRGCGLLVGHCHRAANLECGAQIWQVNSAFNLKFGMVMNGFVPAKIAQSEYDTS